MARTTKATLRRGRERRIQIVKSNKKMAGLTRRLEAAKLAAKEKFDKKKVAAK